MNINEIESSLNDVIAMVDKIKLSLSDVDDKKDEEEVVENTEKIENSEDNWTSLFEERR